MSAVGAVGSVVGVGGLVVDAAVAGGVSLLGLGVSESGALARGNVQERGHVLSLSLGEGIIASAVTESPVLGLFVCGVQADTGVI
jgi:hypothetical protein